jgi:hypothetical protein
MNIFATCRSQCPCGLRHMSAAARLLKLWVRIPPERWMSVCCDCCVLSVRGLFNELITRPEKSYRVWCVVKCDLETSWIRRSSTVLERSAQKFPNLIYFKKTDERQTNAPVFPCISLTSRCRCLTQNILPFPVDWNFINVFTTAAYWIPSCGRVNRAQGLTLLLLLRFILAIAFHTKSVITDFSSHRHAKVPPISYSFNLLDPGYLRINVYTSW